MYLFSIKLPVINKNDPFLQILIDHIKQSKESLKEGDIVVLSEKVISVSQGRIVNLSDVKKVSKKAKEMALECDMDERFVELILQESTTILGGLPNGHVILSKIDGFLIANAGIDQSNAGPNNVILLPKNPKEVAKKFWKALRKEFNIKNLGVIIADSRVQPLRKGTVGISVANAGFEPIEDMRGMPDIFGRPLRITLRAIADDLTSAAQFLLNEGNQQTPIVIIRDAIGVKFTENPILTTEMPAEECLFMNIFKDFYTKKT